MKVTKPIPASTADINTAEEKLGVVFPPGFVAAWRASNGGTVDDTHGSTMERWQMLPVLDSSSRRRIAETRHDIVWYTLQARHDQEFPAHGVVIARASTAWNRLVLLADSKRPGVLGDQVYRQVGWGEPIMVAENVSDLGLPSNSPSDLLHEPLPYFRFHPDPVSTRAISPSRAKCASCARRRGYTYRATWAASTQPRAVCPWCIADGSAATKLAMEFTPAESLRSAGIADDLVDEVRLRTPGFVSFDAAQWVACCGLPATYLGTLKPHEVSQVSNAELLELDVPAVAWPTWRTMDPARTGVTVFHFHCDICGNRRLWVDDPTRAFTMSDPES